jgi:hypothetical protein
MKTVSYAELVALARELQLLRSLGLLVDPTGGA